MTLKRIEHGLKALGYFLLRWLAPPAGSPPTESDLERVSSILVVKPDERIGNAVLVTPLLVSLKGRFSRARLVCLLNQRYWELREHLPSADEFIPFDKRRMARNQFGFLALVRHLRARHFDLVFDAGGDHEVSLTHLALTALSGGRFRVGHNRGGAARFYEVAAPVPAEARHAAEMHLDLLRAVTPIRSHPRPMLRPRPDTGFAGRFIGENGWGADQPIVVIHPGARREKRWLADRFVELMRMLVSGADLNVAVVWGPADKEAAHAVMIAAPPSVKPAGVLSFADFLSLVRHASVFVSGDCGPMHLAAAAGTPIVAIFLASDVDKYRPLGPHDVALDGRQGTLAVDDVAQAILEIIERRKQAVAARAAVGRIGLNG